MRKGENVCVFVHSANMVRDAVSCDKRDRDRGKKREGERVTECGREKERQRERRLERENVCVCEFVCVRKRACIIVCQHGQRCLLL